MPANAKQELLRQIPSVDSLLSTPAVRQWLEKSPRPLVSDCIRLAAESLRRQILEDSAGRCSGFHVSEEYILDLAHQNLCERTSPHVRSAINATGIILHTGLGRAVLPESVVDSMVEELKGYTTLAVDRETGDRVERDVLIEYILQELTGAEAGTVVNNNAAATVLTLAALCGGREAVVSRGELIEIGGSFRLPEVMAQSGAIMVEVGATNRTHLKDYEKAITERTGVLFRAHPSNYRIVGFTHRVELNELAELAHKRGVLAVDDLGAGALVDLKAFGLPHEPTIRECIEAGADIVLASTDKLIGAGQGGLIVGRRELIEKIRRHPLYRALRVDKTCLMTLERTLMLFRDPQLLVREHPTYRMLATPAAQLRQRAEALAGQIRQAAPGLQTAVEEGFGYLGSGSLPTEQLPSFLVAVTSEAVRPGELARRLRMDEACIFARLEHERVLLDVRTLTDVQVPQVAAALGRITK